MSGIPTIVVTPSAAAAAYSKVDRGDASSGNGSGSDFGTTLQRALQGAVDNLATADSKTTEALTGGGNLTDVVTAVSRAELTLQTATAIRDRVLQAYQDIIKMPI
jgi:flagellar hook-basal body complex protein FliE